jgi:hypothetical protein
MEISFCPYRTQIAESKKILYTPVSQPVTFSNAQRDKALAQTFKYELAESDEESFS